MDAIISQLEELAHENHAALLLVSNQSRSFIFYSSDYPSGKSCSSRPLLICLKDLEGFDNGSLTSQSLEALLESLSLSSNLIRVGP